MAQQTAASQQNGAENTRDSQTQQQVAEQLAHSLSSRACVKSAKAYRSGRVVAVDPVPDARTGWAATVAEAGDHAGFAITGDTLCDHRLVLKPYEML